MSYEVLLPLKLTCIAFKMFSISKLLPALTRAHHRMEIENSETLQISVTLSLTTPATAAINYKENPGSHVSQMDSTIDHYRLVFPSVSVLSS